MSEEGLAALKQQLAARQHALADAARAAGGSVDAQQWAEFERLQRLVELESATDSAHAARAQDRTMQLALAGVVALGMLTLLLVRLPTARIALQAQASHATLTLQQDAALTSAFAARWIVLEGQTVVQVAPEKSAATSLSAAVVRIETLAELDSPAADAGGTPKGGDRRSDARAPQLVVRLPTLPRSARVGLEAGFGDGSVAVALCGVQQPLVLNLTGPARVLSGEILVIDSGESARILVAPVTAGAADGSDGAGSAAVGRSGRHGSSTALVRDVCPPDRELRLRFQTAGEALDLQPDLAVREMQMYTAALTDVGLSEPQSTLLGGKLQLLSVKVPPRILQKYELLEPVGAVGRLRSAQLTPAAVAFDFDGVVDDLIAGSPYARESLMPRLLQWFLSRELILVTWSSGLTVLGFALALYRWFGGKP